jgi:hypothetical protein
MAWDFSTDSEGRTSSHGSLGARRYSPQLMGNEVRT